MATKIADAYIEIRTNQAKFSKELKGMERTVRSSTDRMKRNFDRIGKGVAQMSRAARMGFLAMSVAIGGTVYAAAKYQKEMANVSTMLSRKSMPIMKKYSDLVGKMGIIFGESTETLSKGLYDILSASIRPEKALRVLAVSAKAAAAGLVNTGIAADAITTIINSYGYAAEDAGIISDKLFTIIKRGKTTFAELGPNIGKVSALAAQAGLSFDELGASIATMTRAGIRTEMTMTAISGILRVFIKPTTEAKEAARKFGLELDSNTLKTIGLVGVLEKLNGATTAQLALIFPEIEGLKGVAAALGDLTGYTDDYRAMLEAAGSTQEAYLKQTNTLTFTFSQLREAAKYLAVQVGEIFTPIISQAIKKITDLAIKLGQAIKGLTSEQKDSVAQMVLFGTAVLGAIGALSLFSVVARLVMAAGSVIAGVLGLIFSPLGLLIVGIGALVLAWTLGWKKIKDITSKLVEIVVMPTIKFVGEKIENLADWIQEKLGIPKEARKGIWKLTDITTLIDFVADLTWKAMTSAGKVITDIAEWVKENAKIEKIDQLSANIEKFFIDLPEPAKWMFLIAGKAFQYTALAYGIWSAVNALISKLKLPALTPIRLTFDIILAVGTFLIGWDVGKWIQNNIKPIGDFIQKEIEKFQKKHPLMWEQFIAAPIISVAGIKAIALFISEMIVSAIDRGFEAAAEYIGGLADKFWSDFVGGMVWSFKKIWEGLTWEWLNWENFVTALQVAWDNTDWGWFGNSIRWLMGLFKKEIEAVDIDVKWPLWPQADEDTKNIIDNIEEIAKTVEQEIGTKIPKELQLMTVALIASESSFDKNAKAADKLGNEYKGLGQTGKAAIIDLKKMGLVIDDINDPTQAASATMAYFSKILKANGGDVRKSILIYKGWGKELAKQGGNIEKMPREAKRQLDLYLKLLKDFAGESLFYGTLAGKQFVWGSSPGGVVGELQAGQKDLESNLNKMTGQMGKMVDGMSKIFMPIIDMFKTIFAKVISVIKEFDEEAGTELESFVNDVLGAIDDMFGGIEQDTKMGLLAIKESWREAGDDIEEDWDETTDNMEEDTRTSFEKMAESAAEYFSEIGNWLADLANAFADVISGTKTLGEALLSLAFAIPGIGGLIEAFWNLGKAIVDAFTGATQKAKDLEYALDNISRNTETLGEAFKDIGASLTGSINDAERAIRNLMQTQEELAMNTREKLIKELDKYYDWRVLNEMSLTELLAKSAEARLALEAGTLEEIAESAEETAAREKNAKISTLQAIEDAYAKESKLIEKKLKLIEIEIKLLMAAALAEQGKLKEAEKLTREANSALARLLYTQEELDEHVREARDNLKDWGDTGKRSANDIRNATERATGAIRRYGEEGQNASRKARVGFDNARIGIELWGEEINRLPKKIEFEVIGRLDMPSIPRINPRYFDIIGEYRAPNIPSYQVGTPFIPRTMPVIVHREEAILNPSQAREWRAGGAGGGASITIERGAIMMRVNNINTKADKEELVNLVETTITRTIDSKMRRP